MVVGPRNLITDVAGLTVGNADDLDLRSGVTVVLPEFAMVAAADVRGGAPATRDMDGLTAGRLVERIHGIALSGGKEELNANKNLIESVDSTNYFYIKTTAFIKNNENKYLVSGGYDKNFEKNDIVINEEGFVVGFVDKIFQNHSEIVFLDDVDFSMPGLDRFGNEYLIQNNGSQLSIYTTSVNELTANIDFIFTASIFDQPGRFPIVSLSDAKITVDDNKISSNIDIEEISFTFTDIYIVKTNDLP